MATVDSIISNAVLQAQNKSNLADAYTGLAIQQANGFSRIAAPQLKGSTSIREPSVYIPSRTSGVDMALFNSTYGQIVNDLSNRFHDFFTEFFPISPSLMPAVEAWLERAIAGGTGINAFVERQIWQRDRDRIGFEAFGATEEAVSSWASRGYPLPPGAANATVDGIRRKRISDTNAVSREAAIKAFETEIENVRFAVSQAIDYRVKAISAAGDYIRSLASAPDIASKMATQSSDAQARLISAAAGFYNARTNAVDTVAKLELSNADLNMKALLGNQDTDARYTDMRVRAAVSAAEAAAQQGAAALNGLNATVQKIASE